MPVLFIGHGNPMNAIEENEFTKSWSEIALSIPKPVSILCISAHWETAGTKLTAMPHPQTIHDFGGFPQALYAVQYPANGNPELAKEIKEQIQSHEIDFDKSIWGLDHGTWSILNVMYPKADIPVVQMSLNYQQPPKYHYDLAKQMSFLRRKGVLIIGSGNIVHNLRKVDWQNTNNGFDWAIDVNNQLKSWIGIGNHINLIEYKKHGKSFEMAIPTAEHYLPLLYALALQEKSDSLTFFNDKLTMGSLSVSYTHLTLPTIYSV